MTKLLQWYLRLLAGLMLFSALGQLLLPAQLGVVSAWGLAAGWQREIAFWNVAMYIVIVRTLRANDAIAGRTVAIAGVVLQLGRHEPRRRRDSESRNAERDHGCG